MGAIHASCEGWFVYAFSKAGPSLGPDVHRQWQRLIVLKKQKLSNILNNYCDIFYILKTCYVFHSQFTFPYHVLSANIFRLLFA